MTYIDIQIENFFFDQKRKIKQTWRSYKTSYCFYSHEKFIFFYIYPETYLCEQPSLLICLILLEYIFRFRFFLSLPPSLLIFFYLSFTYKKSTDAIHGIRMWWNFFQESNFDFSFFKMRKFSFFFRKQKYFLIFFILIWKLAES